MLYISKGIIYKESGITNVYVSRCGEEYNLLDNQAKLWLKGRFCVANTDDSTEPGSLRELESMGLVEVGERDDAAYYNLLTNCVICPANPAIFRLPLNKNEKFIWKWIKNVGFKLNISELVYLTEQNIIPGPVFFGRDNWHNLIHAIYNQETIFDRILVAKMAESSDRNRTVSAVLGLLRKKRIILI